MVMEAVGLNQITLMVTAVDELNDWENYSLRICEFLRKNNHGSISKFCSWMVAHVS
jgi:hypothetical protein